MKNQTRENDPSRIQDGYLAQSKATYSEDLTRDFDMLSHAATKTNKGLVGGISLSNASSEWRDIRNQVENLGFIVTLIPKSESQGSETGKDYPSRIQDVQFLSSKSSCFSNKKVAFPIDLGSQIIFEDKNVSEKDTQSQILWPTVKQKYQSRLILSEQGSTNWLILYSNELEDLRLLRDYLILRRFDKNLGMSSQVSLLFNQIQVTKIGIAQLFFEKFVRLSTALGPDFSKKSMMESKHGEEKQESKVLQTQHGDYQQTDYSLEDFKYESMVSQLDPNDLQLREDDQAITNSQAHQYMYNTSGSDLQNQNLLLSLKPQKPEFSSKDKAGQRNRPNQNNLSKAPRLNKPSKQLDLSVILEHPQVRVSVESLMLDQQLSWIKPKIVFQLIDIGSSMNIFEERTAFSPQTLIFDSSKTYLDHKNQMMVYSSLKELEFQDEASAQNESSLEFTIFSIFDGTDSKPVFHHMIPFAKIVSVMKMGCCLCVPFKIQQRPCLLSLKAQSSEERLSGTDQSEYYDKVKKVLIQKGLGLARSFSTNNVEHLLDIFTTDVIKKRQYQRVTELFRQNFPPSIMLNMWLIIAKKCKGLLDSSSEMNSFSQDTQHEVQFKSSILRSLMQNKAEPIYRDQRLKNNNIFDVLLKNMENLSKLDQDLYAEKFGLLGSLTDQYFSSSSNRRLLIEYYMLHVHRDYFQVQQNPSKKIQHFLFRADASGLARDFNVIKTFIRMNCPILQKVVCNSNDNIALWLVEKMLSTNLELLKEPSGQYLCQFAFLLSLKHKQSKEQDFG